jgi:hypothetical protein
MQVFLKYPLWRAFDMSSANYLYGAKLYRNDAAKRG